MTAALCEPPCADCACVCVGGGGRAGVFVVSVGVLYARSSNASKVTRERSFGPECSTAPDSLVGSTVGRRCLLTPAP